MDELGRERCADMHARGATHDDHDADGRSTPEEAHEARVQYNGIGRPRSENGDFIVLADGACVYRGCCGSSPASHTRYQRTAYIELCGWAGRLMGARDLVSLSDRAERP